MIQYQVGLLNCQQHGVDRYYDKFSEKEQQKVADCLSSLDGIITAQTKKLATLKTHKKGLMQQLFPALDEVQE